ncbi:MAG: PspC domain-containing protein [archaeon]|jgi:phage shock protein C
MAKKNQPGVKRLYRSGKDKILGGVCGGVAEYFDIDPVIVRLIWAISILFLGFGFLLYVLMWIIVPRNPNHKWN